MSNAKSMPASIDLMSKIFKTVNHKDFLSALEIVSFEMGFERFLVATQWFDDNGAPLSSVTSNYPPKWQRTYAERQYAGLDPTVLHCQKSTEVIFWDDYYFEKSNTRQFFEEAKLYGLQFGLSLPVHEGRGVKSMISLVRDKPILDSMEKERLTAIGKVLASCAHFAHIDLITDAISCKKRPSISPQESQCLRWVAMGKTSAEIGHIMSIAEPTVIFHIKNLMEKLDVKNRSQAIAVAFRFGYLT